MDFRILLNTGEELKFSNKLPVSHVKKQFFPDALYCFGGWGEITFQSFSLEGFFASHCSFIINKKCSIHTTPDIELIRLHIIYKNDFILRSAFGTTNFKERQFNLVYYPLVDVQTEFVASGEYTLFDVTYSREYLLRFAPYLRGLYEFLNESECAHFSPKNLFATQSMIEAIDDVISRKYYNELAKFYMESKALEILTLAFEKFNEANGGEVMIDSSGEERSKNVRHWIDENSNNPGTLREIARRFGTNEFKLKREFRAVYGTSIFDYLLKTKLLRAKILLLDTDKTIAEIAYEIGYLNPGHFSRAFKKEFGVSPKDMRKHK